MAKDRDDNILARAIAEMGDEISFGLHAVAEALKALAPRKADKLTLQYTSGGKIMGAPVSAQPGQVFNPTVVETAAGVPVQAIGPFVYASDNAAIVSVDPNSGQATAASGITVISTANVSVIDSGNSLTDTVLFTVSAVVPPPADKLDLEYGLAAAKKSKR